MAFYVAGKLKVAAKSVATPQVPDKVRRNCTKYLPLVANETLVMVVDTTLLGSGKEGIAITNMRILSYEKSQMKLNLAFRGLQDVEFASLAYDAHGLEIVRSAGRSLKLKISHAEKDQVELIAREIQARMKPDDTPVAAWTCSTCGPGEIIYIQEVRYTGPSADASIALIARDLHICRNCGQASLRIEDPSVINVDAISGAELRRAGGS